MVYVLEHNYEIGHKCIKCKRKMYCTIEDGHCDALLTPCDNCIKQMYFESMEEAFRRFG